MSTLFIRFLVQGSEYNAIEYEYGGCADYREISTRVDGLVPGESHKSPGHGGRVAVSIKHVS